MHLFTCRAKIKKFVDQEDITFLNYFFKKVVPKNYNCIFATPKMEGVYLSWFRESRLQCREGHRTAEFEKWESISVGSEHPDYNVGRVIEQQSLKNGSLAQLVQSIPTTMSGGL